MRIIPAIDIIDSKCVRLTQGDYNRKKVYSEDPLEVAREFEAEGIEFLHLVDLDGARDRKVTNWDIVKSICSQTNLTVDFGGGIENKEDIQKLFDLGIKQVNLGSIAVKQPEVVYEWINEFGQEKIIISADVKNEMVAISGWQEDSRISVLNLINQYRPKGIQYITCTDINADGMLTGPNLVLYKVLLHQFTDLKLVASGGVSNLADIEKLREVGVDGVIVGKAIYEGQVSIKDLRQ